MVLDELCMQFYLYGVLPSTLEEGRGKKGLRIRERAIDRGEHEQDMKGGRGREEMRAGDREKGKRMITICNSEYTYFHHFILPIFS